MAVASAESATATDPEQRADAAAVSRAAPSSPATKRPIRDLAAKIAANKYGRRVLYTALAGIVLLAGLLLKGESRPKEFARAYDAPVSNLTKVTFSHDGSLIAAAASSGEVLLWDVITGKRFELEQLTEQPITALASSADGLLAAGAADKEFLAWEIDLPIDGTVAGDALAGSSGVIAAIAFGPKSAAKLEIAVGMSDGTILFLGTSHRLSGRDGHPGGVKTIAYHPFKGWMVSAGVDGRIVWRDTKTRAILKTSNVHEAEISSLAFSNDGKLLASGDWNGGIYIWDAETRTERKRYRQPDAVSKLAFSGGHLVTASWDGLLRFWSLQSATPVATIDTGQPIYDLAVSPGGESIATVSARDQVDLWRVPSF